MTVYANYLPNWFFAPSDSSLKSGTTKDSPFSRYRTSLNLRFSELWRKQKGGDLCIQSQKFPPSFQAVWNERNIQFKKIAHPSSQRVTEIALRILSLLLFPLFLLEMVGSAIRFTAKKLVLPSAWFYPNQILQRAKRIFNICCLNLHKQFTIQKHKILTPDGVRLNALYFKHREIPQNRPDSLLHKITPTFIQKALPTLFSKPDPAVPTILFYQSNASISQLGIYLWLVEEAVRRKKVCNFVVFDYRGVGSSTGDAASTKDLLIDGDTALQFVKDHLKTPPHLINFYTWSLGGGVGTNIKALYPECTGRLVSERSFSSLKNVAETMIPSFLKPLFFWIPKVAKKEGWDLKAPLERLKGKTLIVFHRDDPTIPYEASAHKRAIRLNLPVESIELKQIPQNQERLIDHHFEELHNYYASPSGKRADQAIADFILETDKQ